jgi:peptidoglycan hydrolase CwlO-like protein
MTFENRILEVEDNLQQLRKEVREQKATIAELHQLRSEWKDFERT